MTVAIAAPMIRPIALFALAFASSGCRRTSAPTVLPDAPPEPDAVAPGAPQRITGSCRVASVTWVAPRAQGERFDNEDGLITDVDAGDALLPRIETATAASAEGSPWTAWIDSVDQAVRLSRHGRSGAATVALGGGNHGDVALVMAGAQRDVPLLAWTHDTMAGRLHAVRAGATLAQGCDQPEGRDEALGVTLAAVQGGALVAWDDLAPGPPGAQAGAVMVQRVAVPVAAGRCPAAHQVSPSDQDASDPVLAPAPDGGAVLVWLAARELDPAQYNDTVTDVWAVGLDATGITHAPPLRVTTTQGHRFGLSAAVSPDGASVWVAWRMVPDSSTEARGDGGQVAVMRLTRTPQNVARPGDAAVVTAADATPTGMPRVFARERGAEVWWRERAPGGTTTLHRTLDANGHAVGGPEAITPEPWLHGALPTFSDGATLTTVQRSPGGGVGLVRYRCASRG